MESERDQHEDLEVDEIIMLKWTLNEQDRKV
jgi:hypothetical protein